MIYIDIQVTGVTPIIFNRFTDEAAEQATNGNRVATVGNRGTPMEICEKKLHKDSNGVPVIPQPMIFATIINGGKFFKAGKSKITTLKSSMIPACLTVEPLYVPIQHKEPWCVDTRPVCIPSTGGRILAHRPIFNDWRIDFEMELDDEILSAPMLREIVDAAGKRIGMGDFRPDRKGPFGKFKVTNWVESDRKMLEAA